MKLVHQKCLREVVEMLPQRKDVVTLAAGCAVPLCFRCPRGVGEVNSKPKHDLPMFPLGYEQRICWWTSKP